MGVLCTAMRRVPLLSRENVCGKEKVVQYSQQGFNQRKRLTDQVARAICFVCAILLIAVIVAIFIFIGSKSFKIFSEGGNPKTFFTVDNWDPTGANCDPMYGGFCLILGSILITLCSIIVVSPLALLPAVFFSLM